MFSRQRLVKNGVSLVTKLSCAVLLVSTTGCSLPVNEEPPAAQSPDANLGDGTRCLSDVVPLLEKFVDGSAKKAEVIATWDCFGTAITTFEKHTRGRFEDRFTAREIANFFERYFLDEGSKISDTLLNEIFKVKQLLVGGAQDSISRDELFILIDSSKELKRIALGLLPYMKVYSFHWKFSGFSNLDNEVKYFEAANLQIQSAAKDLASLIEKNGRGYKIDNLVTLFRELAGVQGEEWPWIQTLEDALPLVHKLKQTLTGGAGNTIEPQEWRRFSLLGARGYVQFLRYHYFVKEVESIGSGPELVYITRSISDLFSYLGDMVEGKPEKVLTRAELLEILNSLTQFLPNFRVSDRLLIEAMKIKQVFFGGGVEQFEKADFDRARAKLEAFRTLTESFLNYVAIYGLSWNTSEAASEEDAHLIFREAEGKLIEVGRRLGEIMESKYDLKNLLVVAEEIDKLYPPETDSGRKPWKEAADKFVPLLTVAKNIMFSDEDSEVGVTTREWSEFLSLGGEGYARYMYYYYFLRNKDLTQGLGLSNLDALVRQTAGFADKLILRKSGPVPTISYSEISRLWTAVKGAGLLPEEMTVKSLDNLTQVVFKKILIRPEKRLTGIAPSGLTQEATLIAKEEFRLWHENQKFMGVVFSSAPPAGVDAARLLRDLENAQPTVALNELKMILQSALPLTYDEQGRFYISKRPIPYSRKSTNWVNIGRALSRLLIRSYALDLKRVTSYQGITKVEANNLFQDVRPFVIEMGWLDPRSETFANSRFLEASLFTPGANGDEYLGLKEGSDLAMMLISGVKVDGLIFDVLEKVCPIERPTQYPDDWTVDVECFTKVYRQEMPYAFQALPDFVDYAYGLPANRYQTMLVNLMKATGYVPDATQKAKVGDVALVPHVSQYVESVIQRWDSNKDGILVTAEVMRAYPVFRNIIKEVSGLDSEKQLKGVFTWLVKYGKPPETIAEKAKFLLWWVPKGEDGWDVEADREQFAKILGLLSDSVKKEETKNAKKKKIDLGKVKQKDLDSNDPEIRP